MLRFFKDYFTISINITIYIFYFRKCDIYHTCYCLSGLSVAQNSPTPVMIGSSRLNALEVIHPVYNLVYSTAVDTLNYFSSFSKPE